LLLEPQRTNEVPFSEQFDNAAWVKQNITISPNTQTAPDGTLSADKLIVDSGAVFSSISNYCRTAALTLTTGVVHTVSVYAKADGFDALSVRVSTSSGMGGGPTLSVVVNLTTGVPLATSFGTYIGREAAANGYYRYIFQTNAIASATNYLSFVQADTTATEGNGVDGISIWGAQLEEGAYATSYVKTEAAAVTRLADAASKTGISSLIGQTEGTLFAEFNARSLSETRRVLTAYADGNNFIMLTLMDTNVLRFLVFEGGAIQANFTTPIVDGNVKMAGAYKANDFVFYVNGVQRGTDTSGTVPATSEIYVGYDASNSNYLADGLNQALLFKTRLTNDQLAELTA
jgi:hypothetical protein